MQTATKPQHLDMLNGPIWNKLPRYALPVAATGILGQLFNAADIAVVGNFTGDMRTAAVAAVGANSPVIGLLLNLFIGIALGANVVIANAIGCRDDNAVKRAVHTAIVFAVCGGAAVALLGQLIASPLLSILNVPEDVFPYALLYLRIYLLGMPVILLYNFEAAIFRSIGDTKVPLAALAVSGVLNVLLNLFFVIVLHMTVNGVAIATVAANAVSAALLYVRLTRTDKCVRVERKALRIDGASLKRILSIGLPAGVQSAVFSFANIVIQSAINSFGSTVVAGSSASANLEGFVYTAMNAFAQAAVTFTSQNIGARKYHNLDRVIRNCLLCVVVTGLVLGGGAALAGHQLLRFYSSDTAVIATGAERLRLICGFYLLCGIMDVLASSLRGLGYSVLPMVVSLVGSCLLRLVWIATIFQLNRTPFMLYISYPISWALTALVHLACLLVVRRHLRQKQQTV